MRATIGHPDLARLYREDWLRPLLRARRPAGACTPGSSQRRSPRGSFKNGRFVPPEPARRSKRGHRRKAGIDAPTARALILGFANFPEELPAHCEQLAALPIADSGTAQDPRRAGQRRLLRRGA